MKPYRSSAPKNAFQASLQSTAQQAGQPVDEQDRISYGVITDVNDLNQVQVKMFRAEKQGGDFLIAEAQYLPLSQPLSLINMAYGPLRKGLVVRIFWRGKLIPKGNAIIEVIGTEDHRLLVKEQEIPALDQQPYKIFSGGVIPL